MYRKSLSPPSLGGKKREKYLDDRPKVLTNLKY